MRASEFPRSGARAPLVSQCEAALGRARRALVVSVSPYANEEVRPDERRIHGVLSVSATDGGLT